MVLSEAERRQLEPIDDSKLVDDVFGFLQPDGAGEAAASQAFGVSQHRSHSQHSLTFVWWLHCGFLVCWILKLPGIVISLYAL